jgi:hypothetical protein
VTPNGAAAPGAEPTPVTGGRAASTGYRAVRRQDPPGRPPLDARLVVCVAQAADAVAVLLQQFVFSFEPIIQVVSMTGATRFEKRVGAR